MCAVENIVFITPSAPNIICRWPSGRIENNTYAFVLNILSFNLSSCTMTQATEEISVTVSLVTQPFILFRSLYFRLVFFILK